MDLDSALTGKPAEGAGATEILRADHREVRRLFAEYERVKHDGHAAAAVAQTLCMQLELHDEVEREVFYPAVREASPEVVDAAMDAHEDIAAAADDLRARADDGEPLDDAFARLRALVERHVRVEEEELFPALETQRAAMLCEIGREIVTRKEALTRSTESFEGPAT